MADTKVRRYNTPLKYKNGAGDTKFTKLFFELDPLEFMDWVINNTFDANELMAGLQEIQDAGLEENPRDLTRDEVATLLNIIKVLVRLSAGKPTDDDEYFLKDPNWTSSYAYRGFRLFLLEKPAEMNQFLKTLLDGGVMEEFTATLQKAQEDQPAEAQANSDNSPETLEKMRAKVAQLEAQQAASQTPTPTDPAA